MNRRLGELPRIALFLGDATAAAAAVGLAYALRFESGLIAISGDRAVLPGRYLEALPVILAVFLSTVAWCGGYGRDHLSRPVPAREAARVGVFAAGALGVLTLLYWKQFQYSRLFVGLAGACFAFTYLTGRRLTAVLIRGLRRTGRLRTRIVLVGGGAPADRFAHTLLDDPWLGLELTAVVPVGPVSAELRARAATIDIEELRSRLARPEPVDVYVAVSSERSSEVPELLECLGDSTAAIHVLPDLGAWPVLLPEASVVAGVPVLSLRQRPLFGARALAKRALDVILSILLLIVFAPVLALVGLAVLVCSGRPILYVQERMGLDGVRFKMLKFRTMRPDAEGQSGPVFTARGDPRATPLGRWLRRFSLDELPQLWNVLRGEMSLVGPRPERPNFTLEFRNSLPGYMLRHSMRSGMTGWAQVHGLRGDTSLEDRLRYDLEYIDRWSLLFDLEILGRTAIQVVVGRNAY